MASQQASGQQRQKIDVAPVVDWEPQTNPSGRVEDRQDVAVGVPIVGIGASAGGLEAFEAFFHACPPDTGMAFVLVPHLAPDHHSLLAEILQRCTAMPVAQVVDRDRVQSNHVYIIPPGREMVVLHGVLQLVHPSQVHGQRLPIDGFFRSLASDQAGRATAIILSGTASDGTLGLRAVHGAGGVCMVQDPATARYDGMPQSAIKAGYAAHILPVEAMPHKLLELAPQRSNRSNRSKVSPPLSGNTLSGLNQVLLQIHTSTGHDFSLYKKSTIGRRIERRMAQHHIEDIALYARFIKQHPGEAHTLLNELLINVTCFFRDAQAFAALKHDILPALLADKPDGYVFRAWVAGCSSGEEAYSIAIVLRELMDEMQKGFTAKIFATDLDDDAIDTARAGGYPAGIEQDVSPERLRRFFTCDEHGYRIHKDIREMVVFAAQNIVKDPPFTRLDLLSCRNLMIYLESELQNRLIPNFHYALKPGGVLFLSSSESIAGYTDLFKPLNRKWKLYRASDAVSKPSITLFKNTAMPIPKPTQTSPAVARQPPESNVATLSNRVLLQSYAPASVTTDANGNILYVHGDVSRFLRQPAGLVTTNVVEMARDGLQSVLRGLLLAAGQGTPTLAREVSLTTGEGMLAISCSLRVLPSANPQANAQDQLLLLSFQELGEVAKPAPRASGDGVVGAQAAVRIEQLERELAYSRENLQATIEEQQSTNEELKSTNEELQSTNEELQSTNEELETSREELQSLNEETLTVNSELNNKIEQLGGSQNDLKNLMDNVSAGIVFLDYHLNIRSYTRDAVKAYRLIASDVGRPLGDITPNLQGETLLDDMRIVLETLVPREREVQTHDGVWYMARMQPYRTLNNIIDGVVLTFTDITASRQAEHIQLAAAQQAQVLAEGIVNTVVEPLVVLDKDLQVISASRAFYQHFNVVPEQTVGRKLYELGNGQWNIPALRELLEAILPQQQAIEGFVVEHDFPAVGRRRVVLNARRITTALGDTEMILLALVSVESQA